MLIKKFVLFLFTLFLLNTTFADSYSKEDKTINFIVTPSVAYRYDVFKYSIPDEVFADRKVSELTWKNYVIQPGIRIEIEPTANGFTFLGQGKYGYILKDMSKSRDKDWKFAKIKGSKERISKIDSNTISDVKGNVLDLSGAIGYSVNLFSDNLLTFYLGYNYTDYKNNNYGARQLVNNRNDVVFSSDQLLQKYNFKTKAPWLGLSLNTPLNDKFTIVPTIKLYSFKNVAKGYWLRRKDFKQNPSLKNTSKGEGIGVDVDLIYKYSNNLDFNINLETKRFKMKKGQDQTFVAANRVTHEPEKVVTRKLWGLSFNSYSISGGIKYKF